RHCCDARVRFWQIVLQKSPSRLCPGRRTVNTEPLPASNSVMICRRFIQSPGDYVGGISTSSGQPETGRLLNGHDRRLRAPLFVAGSKMALLPPPPRRPRPPPLFFCRARALLESTPPASHPARPH